MQALRLRRELALAVNTGVLKTYDAFITGNGLSPAPQLADFSPEAPPKSLARTMPFNVTGNPALAMPTGFSRSGLPVGLQIVGRAFDEPTVLRIAAAYEAASGLSNRRPDLQAVG